MSLNATLRCPCDPDDRVPAFEYSKPPELETRFALSGDYRRRYQTCIRCGHWFGNHDLDLTALYQHDYVQATYGGAVGMAERFARIMALPDGRSDNRLRVVRVRAFARRYGLDEAKRPRLLDVGAGLGVFPAAMQAHGWQGVGLEPDPRTRVHLEQVAGVATIAGTLQELDLATVGRFQLISLNKVLEHVGDPVELLAATCRVLAADGLVYLEVPDAAASMAGPEREEFFIEHHHVFSPTSLAMTVDRAGLQLLALERLREPSGKYTLAAFANAPGTGVHGIDHIVNI